MMSKLEITREQFMEYEGIRQGGLYNMFDPRAREHTTLTKEQWLGIIKQYSDLSNKYLPRNIFMSEAKEIHSECCGAPIIMTDICSECKEHV